MRRSPMRRSGFGTRNIWINRMSRAMTPEGAYRTAAAAASALGEDTQVLWKEALTRRRDRVARPGVTPALPKDWKARCRKVRRRDKGLCRRCGAQAPGGRGAINHILPRRVASPRAVHALNNLALLCGGCHGIVTSLIEPALFRGTVQTFERFLAVIGDPIPSPSTIARAYARIRELAYG